MKAWWWWIALVGCGAPVVTPEAPSDDGPVATASPAPGMAPAVQAAVRPMSDAAARGLLIATDTHRQLPEYVGNDLNCTSCHLEEARRPRAAPWVGAVDRYPRYRARSGRVDDLQDRMTGCFERSMNGQAPPRDSAPMLALVAYAEWLSEGIEDGADTPVPGMPKLETPLTPDPGHGEQVFLAECAACHQADGAGIVGPDGRALFPPLWGPRSFNIAAGLARLDTAASFMKWNMPLGQGGTLTDQEAYDVAAYVIFKDRPDFADKAGDWPDGGKPADARY